MTELVWEGKYVDGKKAAPVRIALPFQTARCSMRFVKSAAKRA